MNVPPCWACEPGDEVRRAASGERVPLPVREQASVWSPDPPDVDGAVDAMFRIAARDVDERWFVDWLHDRVASTDDGSDLHP